MKNVNTFVWSFSMAQNSNQIITIAFNKLSSNLFPYIVQSLIHGFVKYRVLHTIIFAQYNLNHYHVNGFKTWKRKKLFCFNWVFIYHEGVHPHFYSVQKPRFHICWMILGVVAVFLTISKSCKYILFKNVVKNNLFR